MSLRSRFAIPPALFLVPLLLAGCDGILGPDVSAALLRTEGRQFTIVQHGDHISGTVPYTYENRTGSAIYIPNCNGSFRWSLERLEGGRWVRTWSPIVLLCLSSPIVIEDGEVLRDTLWIAAGAFGSNTGPQFDRADPSGTYRVVHGAAQSSYNPDGPPFGELLPLEARTSNSFELKYERRAVAAQFDP